MASTISPNRSLGPAHSTLAVLLSFVSNALAQQILVFGDDALPSCAQQCQLLQQAQTACIPPAAPVTQQSIYESCFCQSGYLTTLVSNPAAVCGSVCQGSDLTQVATWYKDNCVDDGANAAGTPSTATASLAVASPSTSANAASTSAAGSSASSGDQGSTIQAQSQNNSWWAKHWKWVMMVIIIFALLVVFAIAAVALRRYHLRRRDRVKGGFNDGITTRQISAAPPGTLIHPNNPYAQGRTDTRGQSRFASASSFARGVESEPAKSQHNVENTQVGYDGMNTRSETPNGRSAWNRRPLHATAEEDEIGPV